MIKTLFLHPLGPSLILALGGLLLVPLRHRGRASERALGRWAIPLAFLCVLLGGALLWFVRNGLLATGATQWVWHPFTLSGSSMLVWRLDGWNWLAALLLLCLTAAAVALQDDPGQDAAGSKRARRTLWLAAAALAFVFADNLVTLASCWVFLDATLALRLMPAESAQPAGRAWSLLSVGGLALLAGLVFLGEGNIRVSLSQGPFPGAALALLWFAALVRTGAYPLHLWQTGRGHVGASERLVLHVIGPMTGIWLLARVGHLAAPSWLHRPEWAALGLLALLGTALAAWAAPNHAGAWRWIAVNRASLVIITTYIAPMAGPPALVWPLITFALGTSLLVLGQATRIRWHWGLPAWLGALALWGLPGTPGFVARSLLVLPPLASEAAPGRLAAALPLNQVLYVLTLVSEILLVAALWELITGSETPEADQPSAPVRPAILRLGATTLLLAVPMIVWGLVPRQPAILAGLPQANGLPWTFGQALIQARGPVWAGLIATGLCGALLGWLRPMIFTGMRGWQEVLTTLVSLEWLYQAGAMALAAAGGILQYFSRLGEGEGYLGWLALAALLLWVLLRL